MLYHVLKFLMISEQRLCIIKLCYTRLMNVISLKVCKTNLQIENQLFYQFKQSDTTPGKLIVILIFFLGFNFWLFVISIYSRNVSFTFYLSYLKILHFSSKFQAFSDLLLKAVLSSSKILVTLKSILRKTFHSFYEDLWGSHKNHLNPSFL